MKQTFPRGSNVIHKTLGKNYYLPRSQKDVKKRYLCTERIGEIKILNSFRDHGSHLHHWASSKLLQDQVIGTCCERDPSLLLTFSDSVSPTINHTVLTQPTRFQQKKFTQYFPQEIHYQCMEGGKGDVERGKKEGPEK